MRLPIVAIIFLVTLTLLVDWYIMTDVRGMSSRRHRKRNMLIYLATMLPCWALLTVILSSPLRNPDTDILPEIWMLYTYLSIYVPKIMYSICSLIGRLISKINMSLVNYGSPVGIIVAVAACVTMWWGVLFTRHNIDIEEVTVESDRLPESFNGYRIAQISDLHTGTWGSDTTFMSKFVSSVNSLKPDLIVFTGDIVNRQTIELEPFLTVLSRLRAKDGVYSIRGNHDYGDYVDWPRPGERIANNALLTAWETQMGWQILDNTHRWLSHDRDSIALIGVENWGDPPFNTYGNLNTAYGRDGKTDLYDSRYKILLTHNPAHWKEEVTKKSNIDLTLSGHTHAMQIMLKISNTRISPARWRYKEWGGLYNDTSRDGRHMDLYVNIGAGEVAMPSRLGATPEITVITLRKGATK